ncbi:2,3-bisphosphoglycerate-independent phosphoglycerate mutase [Herbinix hemicellulosilytica]|uniref:Putative 2,3-bisphosphoglycerate-independent phosphoglycerate mutase n=1 Tax=Herbinix hemicellulosilytica TaxID=1564487 RepID=A0A0H5SIW7_HERHM|nr:cofactor-independent phosphoglycerate mutase [Herbinix hemicellulosilytica]RBP56905.1 2,3-bisphosphoglycerate-independent phosphoglycerate mutase [Herbinix hemicellulosilytica]CRZ35457.1 putative 2,3-bisphosphoglycerate-independent phosphoglycerate mutase [Herbinix hemicellulosilytica]
MKYIIVLGDGMADEPIQSLGGKTPMMAANTPCMDALAKKAEIGLVKTIPEGMSPGSDTANLSVLGYDPRIYYSGRSPLEALSIGVDLDDTDIALRCNLVTLSEDGGYEDKVIIDHSSGEISTEDAAVLINEVKNYFENEVYKFYVGTSYRHLTVWKEGEVVPLSQPHDILGKVIGDYLPKDPALKKMMKDSFDILNNHPINIERKNKGLNKANSIWFWGAGTRPALTSFKEKYKKKGAMISAVDLLKGIAVGAGMKVIEVPGANGTLHTNYEGKAKAALEVLLKENYDFVYIHVEAPDEMGHQGNVMNKIKAIEYLDQRVVKPVTEGLEKAGVDFRLLIMPDHPTPIRCRTHTADPVPYMLYDSREDKKNIYLFDEIDAAKSGIVISEGHTIIGRLFHQ